METTHYGEGAEGEPIDVAWWRRECDAAERAGRRSQQPYEGDVTVRVSEMRALLDAYAAQFGAALDEAMHEINRVDLPDEY